MADPVASNTMILLWYKVDTVGLPEDKNSVSVRHEPSIMFPVGTGLVRIAVFLERIKKRRWF